MSAVATEGAPENRVRYGIVWLVCGMLLFVCTDTVARHLTQTYPVLQVVWARLFIHLVLMTLVLAPKVPKFVRPKNPKATYLRAIIVFLTSIGSVATLQLIPVANMHAIGLLGPMLVTAFSVPLLGERVNRTQWAAISFACVGAVLIVKPGFGVFQLGSLIALATTVIYSLGHIAARYANRYDEPSTVLYCTALVGGALSSLIVPFFWKAPNLEGWLLILLIGTLSGLGHYAVIKAFSFGDASKISPFNYSSLVWAILAGLVAFGEFPDSITLAGAAIILSSAVFMWRRAST